MARGEPVQEPGGDRVVVVGRRGLRGGGWRGQRILAGSPASAGPYRVEHRAAGITVLAEGVACAPHHSALAAWAGQLVAAGLAEGDLALVDAATGRAVARRRVVPAR